MEDFINKYRFPILGALIGLVLAISFFSLGFLKTIILNILMLLGAFIGYYLQKNNFLKK